MIRISLEESCFLEKMQIDQHRDCSLRSRAGLTAVSQGDGAETVIRITTIFLFTKTYYGKFKSSIKIDAYTHYSTSTIISSWQILFHLYPLCPHIIFEAYSRHHVILFVNISIYIYQISNYHSNF